MIRKTTLSAAVLAATMVFTLAGAQGSGAHAQASAPGQDSIAAESVLTDEVVPVFVEKAVVQPLPEAGDSDSSDDSPDDSQAASLQELVARTADDGALSDELQCLAGAVYFESRGEPLAGQLAVAQVVINRAASPSFPSSYCGVVYQRAQFSFVRGGSMPPIRTGSKAWQRAKAIARIAHRGEWDSEAGDSLYFHATHVSPRWRHSKQARATIDSHIFYR